jgi:hypothetical protein
MQSDNYMRGNAMRLGLGGCAICMRSAFRATVVAWILTVACRQFGPSVTRGPVLVISVLLTTLWVAHILAFSIRRAAQISVVSQEQLISGGRREVLSKFARLFVAAAAVTALPALINFSMISKAYAAPRCGGNDTCDCSTTGFGPFGSCRLTCDSCDGETAECSNGIFGCTCDCKPRH